MKSRKELIETGKQYFKENQSESGNVWERIADFALEQIALALTARDAEWAAAGSRAIESLSDCATALEKLEPDALGIGGGGHEGETRWFLRDELIARCNAALKQVREAIGAKV